MMYVYSPPPNPHPCSSSSSSSLPLCWNPRESVEKHPIGVYVGELVAWWFKRKNATVTYSERLLLRLTTATYCCCAPCIFLSSLALFFPARERASEGRRCLVTGTRLTLPTTYHDASPPPPPPLPPKPFSGNSVLSALSSSC